MLATLVTTFALCAGLTAALPTPVAPRANELWQPKVGTSWQIILSDVIDAAGTLTPDVDVYDVDMFGTNAEAITALHGKGKKVVCYFSAGSYEPGRTDSDDFVDSDMGSVIDGWPDEKWLDITSPNVMNIMKKRIDVAAEKGCDAIDPDNMDGYANNSGLKFTSTDSVSYLRELASHAASLGLSTGLKNAADLVSEALEFTQFVVNEQCHEYSECKEWQPFIAADKPVFNIEYPHEDDSAISAVSSKVLSSLCGSNSGDDAAGFSTIIKNMDLDGWVQLCNSASSTTKTLGGSGGGKESAEADESDESAEVDESDESAEVDESEDSGKGSQDDDESNKCSQNDHESDE